MSESVYGIDLGTTYSAIARINDVDTAEIIQNREGQQTTPSVVSFESENSVIVGAEAKRAAVMEPDNTCMLIKRHMGTEYPQYFQGETYTPEAISSMILATLVKDANEQLGQHVNKVVITVPAYFGAQEREATQQAGKIAGLDVIGIVTEPVAAALSIGAGSNADETIMVYDLGGGTFDTTIMRIGSGKVEVLAVEGDRELGGADWDSALMDLVVEKFKAESGIDEDPLLDEDFAIDLQLEVEELKKQLTQREEAKHRLNYDGNRAQIVVTRDEFESATAHLVDRTIEVSKQCVEIAKQKDPNVTIDRVLLVGGSSRMPMIANALKDKLSWDAQPTDFDLSVAKGAAIYGQAAVNGVLLTGDQNPAEANTSEEAQRFLPGQAASLDIKNVLSRSVGVELVRGPNHDEHYVNFFAHSNDSIPVTPEPLTAATVVQNQNVVQLSIYEQAGERESEVIEDNRLLKEAELKIPRNDLPQGSSLNITFDISAEGLITVHLVEPTTGASLTLEAAVSVLDAEQVAAETAKVSALTLKS